MNEMKKKCPVCFVEDSYLKNEKMSLYCCNNCSHTYTVIDRTEEESYGDDYYLNVHKNWFANPDFQLFENVYNTSKNFLNEKKEIRLADVGCGQGAFLKHIKKTYPTEKPGLNGIDFIKNEYPGIQFESGDFLEMNFERGYNIITSFMVIEHVIDPRLFVKKMVDSLTNDGVIVVNTINNGSLIYRIARFLNQLGFPASHDRLYDHHHLQHYNNKSLKTLLELEGLDVVKIEIHNYPLKAVDVVDSHPIIMRAYKIIVGLLFFVSKPLNLGHNQTLYCKKKN
jgi:SAM-dependent methyltransferase